MPAASAVTVVLGDEWTHLERQQQDGSPSTVWEGEVDLSEFIGRESKLFVCASYASLTPVCYHTLLGYTI